MASYSNETSEALRRYRNGALTGFILLALGLGTAIYVGEQHNTESREAVVDSGRAVAIVGCNRDFHQTIELRTIIRDGRDSIKQYVAEGTLTEAQAARSIEQSNEALERLPLPDCRRVGEQLTSDPTDDITVPAPLYPGHKRD